MSQCCETTNAKTACCETECCDTPSRCPGEADCPIDCAADLWRQSFGQAMNEVQVDILKSKIQKAWGPMMETAADAMLATAGAKWESMIADIKAGEAHDAFKHKLRDLWLSAKK